MPTEYVLGTDNTELARLGLQHQLWSAIAHDAWERAGIRPGSRVLDIGCGPGYAAADLAHLVGPTGAVHGIDESKPFVSAARQRADVLGLTNATFDQGDVQDLSSLEPDSFDVAYARWVLCFVQDPESVVRGIQRALTPGGRLLVQDYFNWQAMRIAPESEAYTTAVRASGRAWIDTHGDPDLVAHLIPIARKLGLDELDLRVHQRLARPGTPMWSWPDSYWKSFIPRLVSSGHMTQTEADAFFDDWAKLSASPDTLLQVPPVYEILLRKAK